METNDLLPKVSYTFVIKVFYEAYLSTESPQNYKYGPFPFVGIE